MEEDRTLGEILRDARIEKGVSLRSFATTMQITAPYLSDIENDRRVPAEEVLRRIATSLGLDGQYEYLMAKAGRFGEETERYLKRNPEAYILMRRISQNQLDAQKLRALQSQIEKQAKEEEH